MNNMRTFEYVGAPYRVLFGNGILKQEVCPLMEKLNSKAAIILSTPEQVSVAETVQGLLGGAAVCVFSEATMHTPTHVTEKALALIKEKKVDGIVSVGGGSTISLGKAVSVRTGLPHLCIPTTYAGSEMTPILGETENGRKVTRRDTEILPNAVLYDVELSKMLPTKISLYSGINAIAHAGKMRLWTGKLVVANLVQLRVSMLLIETPSSS
ncbi:Alcohol dehydrogenase, iron-type [Ilyonectria robusta]